MKSLLDALWTTLAVHINFKINLFCHCFTFNIAFTDEWEKTQVEYGAVIQYHTSILQ